MNEQELIEGCKRQDREAQKELYERYAPFMLGLCRRYVKNAADAEDVMIEGFFKILTRIDQYSGDGSFEGWMRRIMVNESLMFLRKVVNQQHKVELENVQIPTGEKAMENLKEADILQLLNQLPNGYRTVFNLYVIEGYKHREIAEILDISINTSKSQLILAKKRMQELLKNQQYPDID